MGEGAEGIAASSRGSENNGLGSCEAHHVGISPQEDCGGAAGEVGEDTGEAEEGCCLEPTGPVERILATQRARVRQRY